MKVQSVRLLADCEAVTESVQSVRLPADCRVSSLYGYRQTVKQSLRRLPADCEAVTESVQSVLLLADCQAVTESVQSPKMHHWMSEIMNVVILEESRLRQPLSLIYTEHYNQKNCYCTGHSHHSHNTQQWNLTLWAINDLDVDTAVTNVHMTTFHSQTEHWLQPTCQCVMHAAGIKWLAQTAVIFCHIISSDSSIWQPAVNSPIFDLSHRHATPM